MLFCHADIEGALKGAIDSYETQVTNGTMAITSLWKMMVLFKDIKWLK